MQARLRDADEKLRGKEAELDECRRERDAEGQRAREMEGQVRRLQPLIQERDREIQVREGGLCATPILLPRPGSA